MVATMTYHAIVSRGDRYWIVHVRELNRATQARHLRELESMTQDLIAVMTGAAPESFEVEYDIQLPEAVAAHLRASHELRAAAASTEAEATAEARAAARALHDLGLPVRDIGRVLGVSFQRAHQLLAGRDSHRAA